MPLDDRQRRIVRLAYRSGDPELRRRAVRLVRSSARVHDAVETGPTPLQRRLVRLAYASNDPVLRRGVLECLAEVGALPMPRQAKYKEEFLDAVEGQEFHNPATGNKVLFQSLPPPEQKKIYQQWAESQQAAAPGDAPSLDKVEITPETWGTAQDAVIGQFPTSTTSLDEAKKLQAEGKPWRVPLVRPGKAKGQAFWELQGDGDEVAIRWGPVGGWQQKKTIDSIEAGWKVYQKKKNSPKGYEPAPWSVAMSFSGGPENLSADEVWTNLEDKYGDDPQKLASAVKGAMHFATKLYEDYGSKWGSLKELSNGLQKKWGEFAEKSAPKKPEETKAPTGKHKDRKELRSKPKKKMTDEVEVSGELEELLLPDDLSPKKREQAKKQLENANYQLLAMLRDNAANALKKPGGAHMKALTNSGYTPEGIKKMHAMLSERLGAVEGRKYHPDVLEVANKYDLESEDADELYDFKADKPKKGKPLSPQELMQKFFAKAKPETKERMQGMSVDDFMAMYNAIMAEEDEEEETPAKTAGDGEEDRLPKMPYEEVQRAIEEGRLGGEDEEDEEGDEEIITIFDDPPTSKEARLSEEDRTIVRLAHDADPALRRELLALLSV